MPEVAWDEVNRYEARQDGMVSITEGTREDDEDETPGKKKSMQSDDLDSSYTYTEPSLFDWRRKGPLMKYGPRLFIGASAFGSFWASQSFAGAGLHDAPAIYVYAIDLSALLLALLALKWHWGGHLTPQRLVRLGGFYAWLLCFSISHGEPSRRRRILGVGTTTPPESCDEGAATLWILVILALISAHAPVSTTQFSVFSQLTCLQHLLLRLILRRPECGNSDNQGPFGVWLGLPPWVISTIQLWIVTVCLTSMQHRYEVDRNFDAIGRRFVRRSQWVRGTRDLSGGSRDVMHSSIEKTLGLIRREHSRFSKLHRELQTVLPPTKLAWANVVGEMVRKFDLCSTALKEPQHDDMGTRVRKLLEASDAADCDDSIAGFIEQQFTQAAAWPAQSKDRGTEGTSEAGFSQDQASDASAETPPSPKYDQLSVRPASLFLDSSNRDLRIGEWDFDALAVEEQKSHVLIIVGYELLRGYPLFKRDCLSGFLARVEDGYMASSPYHSHVHGADMCNAFYFLTTKGNLWESDHMSDGMRVMMLLAGLAHDIGHPARNNLFLVRNNNELAVRYNDRSVLENYHASRLSELLDEPIGGGHSQAGSGEECGSRILDSMDREEFRKCRQLMIHLILGTDTQKHLADLTEFRMWMGAKESNPAFDHMAETPDQNILLSMLFRCADIGHSAKRWELHEEWSKRVTLEFHNQGDEEKRLGLPVSPLCERENFQLAQAQMGFLQFICLPTWREVAKFELQFQRDANPNRRASRDSQALTERGSLDSLGSRGAPNGVHSMDDLDAYKRSSGASSAGLRRMSTSSTSAAAGMVANADKAIRRTRQALGQHIPIVGLPENDAVSEVIPGAIPGEPRLSSLVFPSPRRASLAGPVLSTPLADACLAQCERNQQVWKSLNEAAQYPPSKSVSPAPPRSPLGSGSNPSKLTPSPPYIQSPPMNGPLSAPLSNARAGSRSHTTPVPKHRLNAGSPCDSESEESPPHSKSCLGGLLNLKACGGPSSGTSSIGTCSMDTGGTRSNELKPPRF